MPLLIIGLTANGIVRITNAMQAQAVALIGIISIILLIDRFAMVEAS